MRLAAYPPLVVLGCSWGEIQVDVLEAAKKCPTMLPVSSTKPAELTAVPSSVFDLFILNPTCAPSVVKVSLDFLRLAIAPGSNTNKKVVDVVDYGGTDICRLDLHFENAVENLCTEVE